MSFLSKLLNRQPDDSTLDPAEFVANRDPQAPVIDVRTPSEFASGHVAGAINVDVMAPDFQSQIAGLDLSEGPVYLYCRSGNRSGQATSQLRQMGHAGAVNVGGFNALVAVGAQRS